MTFGDLDKPMIVTPGVTMLNFVDGRSLPARDYVRHDVTIEGAGFPFGAIPYVDCRFTRPASRTCVLWVEPHRHTLRTDAPPALWVITSLWTPGPAYSTVTLRYAPNSAFDSGPITIAPPELQAGAKILPIYVEGDPDRPLIITQYFFDVEGAESTRRPRLVLGGYLLHPKFEA